MTACHVAVISEGEVLGGRAGACLHRGGLEGVVMWVGRLKNQGTKSLVRALLQGSSPVPENPQGGSFLEEA